MTGEMVLPRITEDELAATVNLTPGMAGSLLTAMKYSYYAGVVTWIFLALRK